MFLEAVERRMRIEERIGVIQPGHEAERETVLWKCVDEGAAELLVPQRIPERVNHGARLDATAGNVPQLLQADRVLLRLAVLAQLELLDQSLGEIAAYTVAEDRHLGVDVHARFVGRLVLAVLAHAAIAGADTDHPNAIGQHVLTGKTAEEVDALGFHLLRQPTHELTE